MKKNDPLPTRMDYKTAKNIINRLAANDSDVFDQHWCFHINNGKYYISLSKDEGTVMLDATFTADELEAIAVWMRNPKECAEAE